MPTTARARPGHSQKLHLRVYPRGPGPKGDHSHTAAPLPYQQEAKLELKHSTTGCGNLKKTPKPRHWASALKSMRKTQESRYVHWYLVCSIPFDSWNYYKIKYDTTDLMLFKVLYCIFFIFFTFNFYFCFLFSFSERQRIWMPATAFSIWTPVTAGIWPELRSCPWVTGTQWLLPPPLPPRSTAGRSQSWASISGTPTGDISTLTSILTSTINVQS